MTLAREEAEQAGSSRPSRTPAGKPLRPGATDRAQGVRSPEALLTLQRLAGNKAVGAALRQPIAEVDRGPAEVAARHDAPLQVQRLLPDRKKRILENAGETVKDKVGGWWGRLKGAASGVGRGARSLAARGRSIFGKADAIDMAAYRSNPDNQTGDDELDSMSGPERQAHADATVGSIGGATPDWADGTLADHEPDRFVVSLAVAQEEAGWMRNIRALRQAALREAVTSPNRLAAAIGGESGGAEAYLGRKVLAARGALSGKDEAEQNGLIQSFAGGLHEVGHTWIRLQSYVGDRLQALYSYGMYPQKLYSRAGRATEGGYGGFATPGPGQIRHPDNAHEGDAAKVYRDYEVDERRFHAALAKASALYSTPPPYVLIGYNCSAFAREILQTAGQAYPGSGLLPGAAYTPGNLYWSIMQEWAKGKQGAHTGDAHQDVIRQVAAEQFDRAKGFEMGLPDMDSARLPVTLRAGSVIHYGLSPARVDKTVTMSQDLEVDAVFDRGWVQQWHLWPLSFGPQTLYATHASVLAAGRPQSSRGEAPVRPRSDSESSRWSQRSDDSDATEESDASELSEVEEEDLDGTEVPGHGAEAEEHGPSAFETLLKQWGTDGCFWLKEDRRIDLGALDYIAWPEVVGLSPALRPELARYMGISLENLEGQIEELRKEKGVADAPIPSGQ